MVTDDDHPDYLEKCPRSIREMKAGKKAYISYWSMITSARLPDHIISSILDNNEVKYDEDGLLIEKHKKLLKDHLIAVEAKRNNVLFEPVQKAFVRLQIIDRLSKSENEELLGAKMEALSYGIVPEGVRPA